jgi:Kef-type K+ transport system membrane component KefB
MSISFHYLFLISLNQTQLSFIEVSMTGKNPLESLLIICLVALILPLIIGKMKSFHLPVTVAEIISGMIIGKSGLDLIQVNPILDFLSMLGLAYLMFLSGLELDFSAVKSAKLNPLRIGLVIFLLTIGLSFFFAILFQMIGITSNPLFLTLIFATTSLGVVSPSLRTQGIIQKPIGQIILLAALVADFGTMLLLPAVMFFITSEKSIDLIYTGIILFGIIVVYFFGKRCLFYARNNPLIETSQIMVRASFAILFIFVVLAKTANLEIILGAFIAGILYSFLFTSNRQKIWPKLETIGYGFLIPIFFILIGVNFNCNMLLSPWTYLLLPLFIYIAYIVKLLPTLVLYKYFGWRKTLGAGILLSSRLSLIIAVSFIALKEKVITEPIHSTFILMAMCTCILSPVIFMQIFPRDT